MKDELHIRPFIPTDQSAVIALWRECNLLVPQNDPAQDIARKASAQPDLFLVAIEETGIVGTVMAGYEGHRGWINYLAVAPRRQRQNIGRRLMVAAEEKLRAIGCPKINLQIRKTNADVIAFYARIGYSEDAVLSFGKRIEHDVPQKR